LAVGAMPRPATTVPGAMAQLAQRPGGPTRALDAAERGGVLGDITNVMGGDKRAQNKGVEGRRAPKAPVAALRSALVLYVTEKHTVGKPISLKDAGANFGVTSSDVARAARKLRDLSLADALVQIETVEWPRPGNPDINGRRLLTKDEGDVLAEHIRLRGDMAFPLDLKMVAATCAEVLAAQGRGEDSWTGKPVTCGTRFVEKFLLDHDLGKYKASAVDPKRIEQATAEVRDAWFKLVEDIVERAFLKGQITYRTPGEVSRYLWGRDPRGRKTRRRHHGNV
jgi:ketosteroid isomerase-like protein